MTPRRVRIEFGGNRFVEVSAKGGIKIHGPPDLNPEELKIVAEVLDVLIRNTTSDEE